MSSTSATSPKMTPDGQNAAAKAVALIKNKFDIFCGKDKCRFKVAAGPKGTSKDTYEAMGSDRLTRNLGQIVTLGVSGAMRQPVKSFQLLGVDDLTLSALAAFPSAAGATFEEIMAFLGDRGYVAWMTDGDARMGWKSVTVVMKRSDEGSEEHSDGSDREAAQLCGLRKGDAFIRRDRLIAAASHPVGVSGEPAVWLADRAHTIA